MKPNILNELSKSNLTQDDITALVGDRVITGSNITINGGTALNGNGIAIMGLNRKVASGVKHTYNATVTINGGDIYRVYALSDTGVATGEILYNFNGGTYHYAITFAVPSIADGDTSVVKINITDGDFGTNRITVRTGRTSAYLANDSYASVMNGSYTKVDTPIQ